MTKKNDERREKIATALLGHVYSHRTYSSYEHAAIAREAVALADVLIAALDEKEDPT